MISPWSMLSLAVLVAYGVSQYHITSVPITLLFFTTSIVVIAATGDHALFTLFSCCATIFSFVLCRPIAQQAAGSVFYLIWNGAITAALVLIIAEGIDRTWKWILVGPYENWTKTHRMVCLLFSSTLTMLWYSSWYELHALLDFTVTDPLRQHLQICLFYAFLYTAELAITILVIIISISLSLHLRHLASQLIRRYIPITLRSLTLWVICEGKKIDSCYRWGYEASWHHFRWGGLGVPQWHELSGTLRDRIYWPVVGGKYASLSNDAVLDFIWRMDLPLDEGMRPWMRAIKKERNRWSPDLVRALKRAHGLDTDTSGLSRRQLQLRLETEKEVWKVELAIRQLWTLYDDLWRHRDTDLYTILSRAIFYSNVPWDFDHLDAGPYPGVRPPPRTHVDGSESEPDLESESESESESEPESEPESESEMESELEFDLPSLPDLD